MVENFYLKGKNQPTLSQLLGDIKKKRIPGVVVLPEHKGVVSECLGLLTGNQRKVRPGRIIHVYQEGIPGFIKGDTNKISCFSRFGSNFESEEIVNRIAEYYGLGYSSGDDGVKRKVPK